MMKRINRNILALLLPGFLVLSCAEPEIEFSVDTDSIQAEAVGADIQLSLSAPDTWVAKTQNPWITVSPANGRGSVDCHVIIDSTLSFADREGLVRIEMLGSGERKDIKVVQKGFERSIVASETEVEIASYAPMDERSFKITVNTNVPFDVEIPEDMQGWISYEASELVLNRGARPRKVTIDFKWDLNPRQEARLGDIRFVPSVEEEVAHNDGLRVVQRCADPIEIGVKGDSLALIAINRALGCLRDFETSERMEHWQGVEIWKTGPNKGRVRKATFYLCNTKESLPFQVKYLTAAEDLTFFSNSNTHLLFNLDPGQHICELTQLKRLNIFAYGLTDLPAEFANLKNLEYLSLASNNFEKIPEVLTRENFPKLRSLILNANQRHVIYDLSNDTRKNIGGLIELPDVDDKGNKTFPKRLLQWSELDTLVLSVNYLQGTIPSLEDDPDFPKWTAAEVNACDTLPARLIGLPKVLPHTTLFTCNLNRLHGELPEWLLYHPCLDLWVPDALVFPQEGKDKEGRSAGFSNEPANLDYYYQEYVNKKYNPNNQVK